MEKTINLGSNRLLPAEDHLRFTAQKLRRKLEIQFAWKDIIGQCFESISDSEDQWLKLVLNLLSNANLSTNKAEKQDIFRRLSVLCGHPKFLFGSLPKKEGIGKKYKSFYKEMCKLYDEFDKYIVISNVFNCYKKADRYLERDSIPSLNSEVDEEAILKIKKQIEKCYDDYKNELEMLFPKKSIKNEKYTLDLRLLKTVITTPKLITMAGTLFVRDMQYFMRGKGRHYKKYLDQGGKEFTFINVYSRWERHQEALATRKCAEKIRNILQKEISERTANTDMELSQVLEERIFRKDLSTEDKNSINYLYTRYSLWGTLSKDYFHGEDIPYPGIGCRTTTLAYKTALKFNLNYEQTKWLVQYMPDIIWGKSAVNKLFQEKAKSQFQNANQIIEYLNMNRQFLNPKNMFFNSNHEGLLKPVKKYINRRNTQRREDSEQAANKEYSLDDFFSEIGEYYFSIDLMEFSLLFSNAVSYNYGMDDFLPEFLSDCAEKLRKTLKKYYTDNQTAQYLNIEELTEEQEIFLHNNPEIQVLKGKIQGQMIWESAEQFLNENIVCGKGQFDKIEEMWGKFYPFKNLPSNLKQAAGFVAFQETTKCAMQLLVEQVIKQLILLTPSLVYENDNSNKV